MTYQLSRRDIRFLEIAYKFGNILGINPSYNFEQRTILHPFLDKIFATISFLVVVATVYPLYLRFTYNALPFTKITLFCVDQFFFITLHLVILFSVLNKNDQWLKLNNNLSLIDLSFRTRGQKETNFLRNVYFQLAIYNLIYVACIVDVGLVWTEALEDTYFEYFVIHEICFYFDYYQEFLVYNIIVAINCRYQDLNNFLNMSLSLYQKSSRVSLIRETGKLCKTLAEVIHLFNDIFGWSLTLIIARIIVKILTGLNFIMEDLQFTHIGLSLRLGLIFSNIFLLCVIIVPVTMVIFACGAVTEEHDKVVLNCFDLLVKFDNESAERQELLLLAKLMKNDFAKFNAASFFEINRTTLLSILGTTTTYFIIYIQFSGCTSFTK